MARKPNLNPEGSNPPQVPPLGKADPAQTEGSPPQPLAGTQGAAATEQAAAAQMPPEGEGPVLAVKGPTKGRWRAGRHFGPEVVTIPARELTEAQIEALFGDPELVVVVG